MSSERDALKKTFNKIVEAFNHKRDPELGGCMLELVTVHSIHDGNIRYGRDDVVKYIKDQFGSGPEFSQFEPGDNLEKKSKPTSENLGYWVDIEGNAGSVYGWGTWSDKDQKSPYRHISKEPIEYSFVFTWVNNDWMLTSLAGRSLEKDRRKRKFI